ncbi:MAG TPA: acetate/propionate family kinase [Polyangiaceae bacterium]|jgi:acetate kinase|nr:acetate/propionate family kinase [Polyangiaceae bacterium]
MKTKRTVLCLNGGSSSLKFAVFEVGAGEERRVVTGAVEGVGTAQGRASLKAGEEHVERAGHFADAGAALDVAFELLDSKGVPKPDVVGHRVVHGGPAHTDPAVVDDALLAALRSVVPIAPLHMPGAIAAMEAVRKRSPRLVQVACFDTAFHRTMPSVASRLPLPEALDRDGVRRYGFHGLSYEYIVSALGKDRPSRIVIAHLGNGSSLVAVKDGVSVDTTMGFTPTGGVPMGTRSGDLDPGVMLYLARERGYSMERLEKLVEHESGLLAVGGASDVKTLIARAPTDDRARLALDLFGYAVRKAIGSFAAVLGGVELLVFTGGIGEHAAEVRARACDDLGFLGLALDVEKNRRNEAVISDATSRCIVRVLPTDEELVIARHASALLGT